jgi:hypothetical protein
VKKLATVGIWLAVFVTAYVGVSFALMKALPMFYRWHSVEFRVDGASNVPGADVPSAYWVFPMRNLADSQVRTIRRGQRCGDRMFCAPNGFIFDSEPLPPNLVVGTSDQRLQKLRLSGNLVQIEIVTPYTVDVRAAYVVDADRTRVTMHEFSFKRGAISHWPLIALVAPAMALLFVCCAYFLRKGWLRRSDERTRLKEESATVSSLA